MKIAIPIDVNRLQMEINLAESNTTFKNQSELFKHISNTEWARTKYKKPLTPAVLYLRVKQEGLIVKTPKGKRGRVTGAVVNRGSRKDKLESNKNFKINIDTLKRDNPEFGKLIAKLAGGSMQAAVKLNCINCCGGDKKEAANCNVTGCALYLFNPYRKSQ